MREHPFGIRAELQAAAERLASEFPGITTCTVLRCYARAARLVRSRGVDYPSLPAQAEFLTRILLARRMDGAAA